MTVSAILKGRPNSDGKKTVYIRTNIGKKRTFNATKIKIHPSDWIGGRVKNNHPQATHYNQVIKKLVLERELDHVNGNEIDYADAKFCDYATRCIERWEGEKKNGTIRRYRSDINKIKEYNSDFYLSSITNKFLDRYKKHCIDNGDAHNTIWRSFAFIRCIVRQAHRDRIIQENVFDSYRIPQYKNPKKFYLTKQEIDKIEDYSISQESPKHLSFAAAWFVIGCYTGLRYGDMNRFNREENIRQDRFILYTQKTGELVSMKLHERLKQLLERVDYKPIHLQDQPFNRYLKDIQKSCGIKTRLTVHVARHTFGVRCADSGLSIETTARLMGHSDIKTTSIYYKITNQRLDKEVELLF
jgi:site-specific recombinase XerD